MKRTVIALWGAVVLGATLHATEFHVAVGGKNSNTGTSAAPFYTIQHAAGLAQPGDVITVHEGVYRERISPPRGGASDVKRIVYRAAPGEKVVITGAEPVKDWVKVTNDAWRVTLPNSFFGAFNPYGDLIHGDWFSPLGRQHHTGAVYLNGDWLVEAAKLDDVLMPPGTHSSKAGTFLMNVSWIRPANNTARISADRFSEKHGIRTAPCVEGGQCIGWIEDGDWTRYEHVDFGGGIESVEIRAASVTGGGEIELHLDKPDGELLGTCSVSDTGNWQSWTSFTAKIKPTSGVKNLCLVFKSSTRTPSLWFGQVDRDSTTIWAQFKHIDPNVQNVEINVRQTVFYPIKTGINYLTVRGFILRDAATPWAPPTAEQVGLIGTHWSKGWIIESNDVSYSVCSGISLGKYGDAFDNTSANTAEGYVKTIERALLNGWNEANVGHHLVRDNAISHCEQAGIVGSLGCAFSRVTGNVIHDIHVRRLFTGAEMAGIKFHGAVDVTIGHNHIYRTTRGLWLDWMAQGTHVEGNLFHDNLSEDLFVEVNHGPFIVDNNLFLSGTSLLDVSEGGAYAHNLFTGKIVSSEELSRETPYHPAHSTTVAGLVNIKGGDNRYYNNLFVGAGEKSGSAAKEGDRHRRIAGYGLWVYDTREYPLQTGGNVFFNGALPSSEEANALVLTKLNPGAKIVEERGHFFVCFSSDCELKDARTRPVSPHLLGATHVSKLSYENAEVCFDYFGVKRGVEKPTPGPFQSPVPGDMKFEVW